jgi:hypothetical protein
MLNETPGLIASEDMLWLRSDGTEAMISVKICEPYKRDDESWACPVSLDGIHHRYFDIVGVSSLQALCLAISFVWKQLDHMLDSKGTLVDPVDRTPWDRASLSAIFGRSSSV